MYHYNWIFNKVQEHNIKKLKPIPFKLNLETSRLASSARLNIENKIAGPSESLRDGMFKCGLVRTERAQAQVRRGSDTEVIIPDPVFTFESGGITTKYFGSLFLIGVFLIGEVFITSLFSAMFLPGYPPIAQMGISVFFALMAMFGLMAGYKYTFKHLDVLKQKKSLGPYEVWKSSIKLFWSLITLGGTFVCIVAAGLARVFFLEDVVTDGLSVARVNNIHHSAYWTSIFTVASTVVAAMLMAHIKYEQLARGIEVTIYRKWRRSARLQERCYRHLIRKAEKVLYIAESISERDWQLVLRTHGIYKQNIDVDERDLSLDREYHDLSSRPDFVLTDSVYRRFASISCKYEQLFKYSILSSPAIREKIIQAREAITVAQQYILEITPAHMKAPPAETDTVSASLAHTAVKPTNGSLLKQAMSVSLLIFFGTSLFSCTPKERRTSIVAAIDYSLSRDSRVHAWYRNAITHVVIPSMGQRDRITLIPIDAASETNAEELFTADFSVNHYENALAGYQSAALAVSKHHDSCISAGIACTAALCSGMVRRRPYSGQSDILGALKQAARFRIDSGRNVLLLFTDGLQATAEGRVDFERLRFSKADISSIVATMPRADLHGFEVLMVTGNQSQVDIVRFNLIGEVWKAYVNTCGGTLIGYTSSSTAQLTSLLRKQ